MRKLAAPLVLILGACATAPVPSAVQASPASAVPAPQAEAPVQIPKVLIPSTTLPLATVRLLFRTGSIDDPKGREGLTALAAQMMAQGGTQELPAEELLKRLLPMAAELSVSVDKENTVFVGRVHRDHLARFVPLLVDVVTRPRFDPKEFERLRAGAVNEVEKSLRSSDDEALSKLVLEAMIFRGHPYEHFVGGSVQGLKAITLPELQAHAARVFTQERLTLGVAGAHADEALAVLEEGLRRLPARGAPVPELPPAPKPHRGQPRVVIVEKEAAATAFALGHPVDLRRGAPDFYAFMVGVSALGEHRQLTGRLMKELRVARGLNYGDYAYPESFRQEGSGTFAQNNIGRREQSFTIWLRPIPHENRVFGLRAALYELDKYLKEGIGEAELKATKAFLAGYTLQWEEVLGRRLGYALDDRFYGTDGFLPKLREKLPSLTVDEVNAALRAHLRPSELRVAIVTQNAEQMKKDLLSGQPSPPRYETQPEPRVREEDGRIQSLPFPWADQEIAVLAADSLFEGSAPEPVAVSAR